MSSNCTRTVLLRTAKKSLIVPAEIPRIRGRGQLPCRHACVYYLETRHKRFHRHRL
jgi:hypothetical protein